MNYQVNDRLGIEDELATVRWVGSVQQWGNSVLALGIEWDDCSRGKNDGILNGIRYFTPIHTNGGSFIKSSNSKIRLKKSFIDILIENYGCGGDFREINLGSKFTQSYGFNKLNQLTQDFDNLKTITLERKMIDRSGCLTDLNLPKLLHLDLCFNLFTNFNQIINILNICPIIQQLNVNGNRFVLFNNENHSFPIKILKLSSCFIKIDLLITILSNFSQVEELYLAGNDYTDDDISKLFGAINLKLNLLDLSFNHLTLIPNLSINTIILTNNSIKSLNFSANFSPTNLDLRYNLINDWYECDKLIELKDLKQLRVNGNPLFDNLSPEEQAIYIIARTSFHGRLNGTTPSQPEVVNADLYFISQVKNCKIDYIKGDRWKNLLQLYQIDDNNIIADSKTHLQRKLLKLNINYMNSSFSRWFLISNSVLRLKGIISNKWNLPILDMKVYYLINNIRLYLDDDISILDDYRFNQEQDLYVDIS
jgi:hypothetical protein